MSFVDILEQSTRTRHRQSLVFGGKRSSSKENHDPSHEHAIKVQGTSCTFCSYDTRSISNTLGPYISMKPEAITRSLQVRDKILIAFFESRQCKCAHRPKS